MYGFGHCRFSENALIFAILDRTHGILAGYLVLTGTSFTLSKRGTCDAAFCIHSVGTKSSISPL